MSDMYIEIEVENREEELESFPVTHSIFLKFSSPVETTSLDKYIILSKIDSETLLSLSEEYSYNLGYIKENFDNLPLEFEVLEITDTVTRLKLTPKLALKPDSKYRLFVDKNLSTPSTTVTKSISKSTSFVEVEHSKRNLQIPITIKIDVISQPKITTNDNIVKLGVDKNGVYSEHILNLKENTVLDLQNVKVHLKGEVFAFGESFLIRVTNAQKMQDNFLLELKTALSSSIKPINPSLASNVISNADVLAFYDNSQIVQRVVDPKIVYLSENSFKIYLEEVKKEDIDLDTFQITSSEAFQNYLLNKIELYNENVRYRVFISWDDFDDCMFIEVEPFIEEGVEKVLIDLSRWE